MGESRASIGLDDLVAMTPDTRDRFMDFLRAASITTVVIGHWFISLIHWRRGVISTTSAIGVTRGLWLATWVLQVMPIFFFVGGFSNLVAYDSNARRGNSTWTFIRSRLRRLLRPSFVLLGIWAVAQIVLHLTNTGGATGPTLWGNTHLLRGMYPPGATIPFGPLWFLGMYIIVVALSPMTIRLHRRFGWAVPITMGICAVIVDITGFGFQMHFVRYANVAFVLLLPHQLGHLYADGAFGKLSRRTLWLMVLGGVGALVLLTNQWMFQAIGGAKRFDWFPHIGAYPRSLLGTDVESISNAYPPTLCYLAVGIWTIGAALLLKKRLTPWLQRERPWKTVVFANTIVMTLFLWHMTAFLLAVVALWPLGFGHGGESNARWWSERPLWLVAPGAVLSVMIAVFARYEQAGKRPSRPT
ncbi:MAG: acyltransferase [Actinomycetota bacterium]|nr:acyltransferase [Actinomycetota bacterium]